MRRIGFFLVLVGMLLAVACQPEIVSHKVTILGLESSPIEVRIEHGGKYHLPALPEKEGHTFDGITGGIEGQTYAPDKDIVVESDLTLTYNWKTNKHTVHVVSGEENIPDVVVEHGKTYTPERKTRSGYIFQNIKDEEGAKYDVGVPITVTSDLTLTYNWKSYSGPFAIGDTGPAGGMIFYVDEGNEYPEWDYLETSTGKDGIGYYQFGCYCVDNLPQKVGAETGVGAGKRNTEMLVAKMGDIAWDIDGNRNVSEYAAKMCADYAQNGYDDWFLPSKDELYLVWENLQKHRLVDLFPSGANGWCWSSSEVDDNNWFAWPQDFAIGGQQSLTRTSCLCVRPVRAF